MKHHLQKLNRFLHKIRIPSKVILILMGVASTAWFLIRVIPKPSRVAYPCMKAAAPVASSFITYLIGITGFTFLFRKARERLVQSRYIVAGLFILLGLAMGTVALINNDFRIFAATGDLQGPQTGNEPVGVAKGIFPGRVVWAHNIAATNENYEYGPSSSWQDDENTDPVVVSEMLSAALQDLAGTTSDADAWDAIFRYYNNNHGRGDNGYTAGEKIAIKLNLNGDWGGSSRANTNTSPQVAHALLDQLINVVGVAGADIHIGDANKAMYQTYYDYLNGDFGDVNYWGDGAGRVSPVATSGYVLKYSDGTVEHRIPQSYVDATYFINVPVLKKHHRSGISISSKNHFGTIAPFDGGAWNVHYSLPFPETYPGNPSGDEPPQDLYGAYRCFVDIMGHEHLGGKTILYLVDGLWSSTNWGHPPIKWRMLPFGDGGPTMENADWPNSLLLSQDPVAIESVCYDFLYHEFDEAHPTEGGVPTDNAGPFSHFGATDDFLHQAASPANWAAGITYDPEGDGSALVSLGTHEHWNNAVNKQYSRNLGSGDGIELVKAFDKGPQFKPGSSGLVSEIVNVIYVDSFDVKWFGTDMGISRFDDIEWDTLDSAAVVPSGNGMIDNNVKDIAYEKTGYGHEIWIATDGGLSVAGFDIDGVTSATTYHTGNSGILNDTVEAVGVDSRHNRWVGGPDGVSVYLGSDWTDTIHFMDEDREWELFTGVDIFSMGSYEKDSMIYIATHGEGLLRYEHTIDGYTGASAYGEKWSGLFSNDVNSVTIIDTTQWIGTPEGAYWHIGNEVKGAAFWDYFDIAALSADGNVNAIEVDDIGNVWFGTDAGLVIRTTDGWYKYEEADGIIDPMVNDIKKDFSGNVWIATDGGVEYFSTVPGVMASPDVPDQAINITVTDIEQTSATISWSNGTGDYRAVFMKEGNSGTVAPMHGDYYLPDDEFGAGDEKDGWYCVYNATGSDVDVTGLTQETEYRIMVCEYENPLGFELYNMEVATDNPVNFETDGVIGVMTSEKENIRIYPMPFNDYLRIDMEIEGVDYHANIYSLDGKLQLRTELTGINNEINTSMLPAGAYILQITNRDNNYSYKIVK